MSTTSLPATRPDFVFVPYDDVPDRSAGMPSDRERVAIHRAWLAALDAGTMPATKIALLDTWSPGWRSDAAREFFAAVPTPRTR